MRISDWSSDVCSSDLREFRIVEDTDQHRQVDAGDHADAVVVSELVGDVAGCRTECIGQNQYAIPGIKSLDHLAALLDQHLVRLHAADRPDERRVGKVCVSRFSTWLWPYTSETTYPSNSHLS